MRRLLLTLAAIGCLATGALAAPPSLDASPDPASKDKPGEPGSKDAGNKDDDKDKDKDKDKEPPPPVVTEHTITLPGGRVLKYKATAGYLTLRDTTEPKDAKPKGGDKDKDDELDPLKGKPKARVFFVAYTLDPAPAPATPTQTSVV